jgi:hypothetical protein
MSETWYIYGWGNNPKRKLLKHCRCKIIKTLKKNSVLVQFENGEGEVISRRALKKEKS